MFIETPIFPTNINFESMGTATYEVFITTLYGGHHVADLTNDEPLHSYNVGYGIREESDLQVVLKHFHAMQGMFHFFRFKDWNDYKSCDREATPTAFDQVMGQGDGSNLTFQMIKNYTSGGRTTPRRIEKPVIPSLFPTGDGSRGSTGIILVGVQSSLIPSSRYSLTSVTAAEAALGHLTMGRVVFGANVTKNIIAISQAANGVVQTSAAHTLSTGDSVHFSGVGGMTQINGLRGIVTVIDADEFSVNINTSGFSAYTTGGVINTIPQAAENVSWGGEFHVPVRYNVKGVPNSWHSWRAGNITCDLEEVRLVS